MDITGQFSKARYISLETYRKTGAPVATTVWVVVDGGTVYIRTDPRSGKVKRIRRNPRVRLAPANSRGQATSPWEGGMATFVEGPTSERILDLFKKKYGLQFRLVGSMARLRGIPMQVIAISFDVANAQNPAAAA